jgi:hypothetical protein
MNKKTTLFIGIIISITTVTLGCASGVTLISSSAKGVSVEARSPAEAERVARNGCAQWGKRLGKMTQQISMSTEKQSQMYFACE